jgi:hypothetical protein
LEDSGQLHNGLAEQIRESILATNSVSTADERPSQQGLRDITVSKLEGIPPGADSVATGVDSSSLGINLTF